MNSKKKYYVVWKGRIPGIYQTWAEAKEQIDKFENAVYKAFTNSEQAREAFEEDYRKYLLPKSKCPQEQSTFINEAIAVDAACSGNPGKLEYQGVYVKTRKQIFYQGTFEQGTNNIGEFLALVHALAYCKKNNLILPIYSDSVNAIIWVKQKKAKTKLFRTAQNEQLFELIARAENWLQYNNYENKIMKWNTEVWGEIPADFGRK